MEGAPVQAHISTDSLIDSRWSAEQGADEPFLSCIHEAQHVNWSDELEELHEDISRTHFIDVWTRRAMLARIGALPAAPIVIDVGCSTGYLLADLHARLPDATLVGVD